MKWTSNFNYGRELVISTSSLTGKPHANIVISLGWVGENQFVFADCQMRKTIDNLKKNSRVCVIGGYVRVLGKAKIYHQGEFYNFCVKKTKQYQVCHAIVVTVQKVYDLDKGKILKS